MQGAYTCTIFCVSNKQVRHKVKLIFGGLIFRGLIFGGLIFGGGAYIWNKVSVSTCGGLVHGGLIFGGLISGGAYIWGFTVIIIRLGLKKLQPK